MKYSYWVSYQFQAPGSVSGFGDIDVTTTRPLSSRAMDMVKDKIRSAKSLDGAVIVIMAFSKFES